MPLSWPIVKPKPRIQPVSTDTNTFMTPIKRDGGARLSVCNVFPFWTTHYAFYIAFALTRREGPSSWKSRKWSLLLQSLLVIIIIIIVISRVTAPRVGQSERWSLYAMNLPLAVQRVEPLLMTVQNYFLNNVVKKIWSGGASSGTKGRTQDMFVVPPADARSRPA